MSRTYTGGVTNQIEFTGALTVGNFSSVDLNMPRPEPAAVPFAVSWINCAFIPNILTGPIQQAQLEYEFCARSPCRILRQPTNVVVTASPFKTATFTVDALWIGGRNVSVAHQWRQRIGRYELQFYSGCGYDEFSGTLVSVYVDNALTVDPGV